jgi:hypothetical protein
MRVVHGYDAAVAAVNGSSYGLSAAVFTRGLESTTKAVATRAVA